MPHKLTKIAIRNFRSIRELELNLDDFSPLIGQNNAGKSNILNAIAWFVKPAALEAAHFNQPDSPIEVEATIEGITPELLKHNLYSPHAARISPFLDGDKIRIKRCLQPKQTKATDAKLQVFSPSKGGFEDNPTGISTALQSLFPEPVRIEAMVDATEDAAKNKSGTTLSKLISLLTDAVVQQQGAQIKTLLEDINDALSASGKNRSAGLKDFDRDASKVLEEFFPGLNVMIDFPAPKLPDLLKSGTVKVRESTGEQLRDFSELGHGAQRSIQMALLQLLAAKNQGEKEAPLCTVLLIDEPELYLHPQAVEQVKNSLKKLAGKGFQIIFSTHSPLMIGREDAPQTNIIRKRSPAEGTVVHRRMKEALAESLHGDRTKQMKMLFDLTNAKDLLFSPNVLLVEGHSEVEMLSHFYRCLMGKSLVSDHIGLVKLSGCGDLSKTMEILKQMDIKAHGLVDLDFLFVEGKKAGYIKEDDTNRKTIIQWFETEGQKQGMVLEKGLPTNKSPGKAEGAFRAMAQVAENKPHIEALHESLKSKNIWAWQTGSLEQVLGLEQKNDPEFIAELCAQLDEGRLPSNADRAEAEAFCRWLQTSAQTP